MIFWIAAFLATVLLPFTLSSAVLPAQWVEEVLVDTMPTSPNNKTTIERLFKRALSCTFNSAVSSYCSNSAYCCWKFEAGADSNTGGGFCCPNDQDSGGGCCGNSCCPYAQYCAWADSLGNYSCVPASSRGSGYPTVTQTDTVTTYQTITKTVTNDQTTTEASTKTQSVASIQAIAQSILIYQISVETTTNNAGQTIVQTFTISSVLSVPLVSATVQAFNTAAASGGSGINGAGTWAIVGGAIGGVALLATAGLFIFIGRRRQWFYRTISGQPPTSRLPQNAFMRKVQRGFATVSLQGKSPHAQNPQAQNRVPQYGFHGQDSPGYGYQEMPGSERFHY